MTKVTSNFRFQSTANPASFTTPDYSTVIMNLNDPATPFRCSTYLQYDQTSSYGSLTSGCITMSTATGISYSFTSKPTTTIFTQNPSTGLVSWPSSAPQNIYTVQVTGTVSGVTYKYEFTVIYAICFQATISTQSNIADINYVIYSSSA